MCASQTQTTWGAIPNVQQKFGHPAWAQSSISGISSCFPHLPPPTSNHPQNTLLISRGGLKVKRPKKQRGQDSREYWVLAVWLARKEGVCMSLLLSEPSGLISCRPWIELSKPAEQYFPEPLRLSHGGAWSWLPQCMPAFGCKDPPVAAFLFMYRERTR